MNNERTQKIYREIDGLFPNYTDNKANMLSIHCAYSNGGYNNMTGEFSNGGLYLHFTPVTRTTNADGVVWESQVLFAKGSFKVRIKDMPRRSAKEITKGRRS